VQVTRQVLWELSQQMQTDIAKDERIRAFLASLLTDEDEKSASCEPISDK
jgi:hypothetical protein